MERNMIFRAALALLLASIAAFPVVHSWGKDGHRLTCMIAEERLSASAGKAIEDLLPGGDFPSHCTWPDEVRRTYKYRWSGPLHYIDTPDDSCSYDYQSFLLLSSMYEAFWFGAYGDLQAFFFYLLCMKLFGSVAMATYRLSSPRHSINPCLHDLCWSCYGSTQVLLLELWKLCCLMLRAVSGKFVICGASPAD